MNKCLLGEGIWILTHWLNTLSNFEEETLRVWRGIKKNKSGKFLKYSVENLINLWLGWVGVTENPRKGIFVLLLETCDYVKLHGKRELRAWTLRWRKYLELLIRIQHNHMIHQKWKGQAEIFVPYKTWEGPYFSVTGLKMEKEAHGPRNVVAARSCK